MELGLTEPSAPRYAVEQTSTAPTIFAVQDTQTGRALTTYQDRGTAERLAKVYEDLWSKQRELETGPPSTFAEQLAETSKFTGPPREEFAPSTPSTPSTAQGGPSEVRGMARSIALDEPRGLIRRLPNDAHLVTFESRVAAEIPKRMETFGASYIPKLKGWVVPAAYRIDQVEARVLGRPIPGNLPGPVIRTEPPIDLSAGGLKAVDPATARSILGVPKDKTRDTVIRALTARGYRLETPAKETNVYLVHPGRDVRYMITQRGQLHRQNLRPGPRPVWVNERRVGPKLTLKRFANSIRNQLNGVVAAASATKPTESRSHGKTAAKPQAAITTGTVTAAAAVPSGLPTNAKALRDYRRERGYGPKTAREILESDVTYKVLAEAAKAEERAAQAQRGREGVAKTKEQRQASVAAEKGGQVDRAAIKFAPLSLLPRPLKALIQEEAGRLIHLSDSERVRAALQRIIDDLGVDKGAEVEHQKERITAILAGELDQRTIFERGIGVPQRPANPLLGLFLAESDERAAMIRDAVESINRGEPDELARWADEELSRSQDHPYGAEDDEAIAFLEALQNGGRQPKPPTAPTPERKVGPESTQGGLGPSSELAKEAGLSGFDEMAVGDAESLASLLDAIDQHQELQRQDLSAESPELTESLARLLGYRKALGDRLGLKTADVLATPDQLEAARRLRIEAQRRAIERLRADGLLPEPEPTPSGHGELTPEQQEYLRRQADPGFGLGATAAEVPGLAERWAKLVDDIIGRIAKTTPGSIPDKIKTWAGHMWAGTDFFLDEPTKRLFASATHGVRNWSNETAGPLVGEIKAMDRAEIKRRKAERGFVSPKRAAAIERRVSRQIADVLTGRKPQASWTAKEKALFENYARPVRAMSNWLLNNDWTWPYIRAFGFENVEEVIRIKSKGEGAYLRQLYRFGGIAGPQAPRREIVQQRYVNGIIRGGQFKQRLGDEDHFVVIDKTERGGRAHAFRTLEDARDAAKAVRDAKRARWGSRVDDLVYVVSPFNVAEAAKGSWYVVDESDDKRRLREFKSQTDALHYAREERLKLTGPDAQRAQELIRVENRALLIPETDAKIRVARTILDSAQAIGHLRLFQTLRETISAEENPNPTSDPRFTLYQPMPFGPSWGPLAGRWVPNRVYDKLIERERVLNTWWANVWRWATYTWNSGHTVWNVGSTWFKNWAQDSLAIFMDGHSPWHKPAYFVKALQSIQARDSDYMRHVKSGNLNTGWAAADLRDLRGRLVDDLDSPMVAVQKWLETRPRLGAALQAGAAAVGRTNRALGYYYDLWANVLKHGAYLYKTQKLGWSHDAAIADSWMYLNYDNKGKLAAWSQHSGLGQGIGAIWTANMARIIARGLRDRPIRTLALLGMPLLLDQMGKLLAGADDDELELIRKTDPRFKGYLGRYFMVTLPMRDDRGRLRFWSVKSWMPLGDSVDFTNPSGGLKVPFLFSHPLVELPFEVASNRDAYTGQQIVPDKVQGTWPRAWAWTQAVLSRLAPLPSRVLRPGPRAGGAVRLFQAAIGESKESVWHALLSEGLGIEIKQPWIRIGELERVLQEHNRAGDWAEVQKLIALYRDVYREED